MNFSDLVFIDSAGYHYPDFPTILSWLQGEFQTIYGSDIVLDSSTMDGQWISILAQAFFDVSALGASTYNSFSPSTAQGVGLARVVKINGIFKQPATFSTVNLDIGGVAGTNLIGALASDAFQQQWSIPTTTIPEAGTITVTATSVVSGAIQATANTITQIVTPTQGWQTVNNPADATIGQPVQTDAQLRIEQTQSVSLPALTVFDATVAAVRAVPGVTNAAGYENPTNSTDANSLPPHSIAIVVAGGDSMEIAQAIQIKKTPGTQTDGTTTELVSDSHGMPINISFYIATQATIHVQVTISVLAGYSSSFAALIQNAVAAVVTSPMVGANGIIGGTIVLNQIYAAAYLPGTQAAGTYTITSILIAKNGGSLGSSNITLLFNEIPICIAGSDVTVVT